GTAGALIVAVKGLKTAYGEAVQTVAKKRIMLALATLLKRIDADRDSRKLLAAVNLALERSTGKKTKLGALIKSKAAAAELKREQRKWVAILLQAKLIDKPPL
ncbi:MAG: hypothetical protein QF662_07360, partial [Phycisphaerae bacterium]|nr:hypothetical protein [Phycisphaerae bacterium]